MLGSGDSERDEGRASVGNVREAWRAWGERVIRGRLVKIQESLCASPCARQNQAGVDFWSSVLART